MRHQRTHTLLVHEEQMTWSLQLKFQLLFIMSAVNTKLELELEFVS